MSICLKTHDVLELLEPKIQHAFATVTYGIVDQCLQVVRQEVCYSTRCTYLVQILQEVRAPHKSSVSTISNRNQIAQRRHRHTHGMIIKSILRTSFFSSTSTASPASFRRNVRAESAAGICTVPFSKSDCGRSAVTASFLSVISVMSDEYQLERSYSTELTRDEPDQPIPLCICRSTCYRRPDIMILTASLSISASARTLIIGGAIEECRTVVGYVHGIPDSC
jgi:hypothetical protein